MTEPLPNCRSIWPRAVSRACSRSNVINLLGQPIRRLRTALRRTAARNGRAAASDGLNAPSAGQRRARAAGGARKRSDGDVRKPRPPLGLVDAERLEPPVEVARERRRARRPSSSSASMPDAARLAVALRTESSGPLRARGGLAQGADDRLDAPPAGRWPRKASVTCRFAAGSDPDVAHAREAPRPATRRARRASRRGGGARRRGGVAHRPRR